MNAPTDLLCWGRRHRHFTVLSIFILLTAVYTWPLPARMGGWLSDAGDPLDSCWRFGVIARQLVQKPLELYRGHTFYPYPNDLALDEFLTGNAFLAAPVIWLSDNPVLAFNLLTFGNYALSGFAMYLLAQHLTGSGIAGLVAGVTYGFCPNHYVHIDHVGIAAQQWMVFAFYCLVRFLEDSRPQPLRVPWLWLFGLFFTFQALAAGYHAYTETLIVGLYLCAYLFVSVRRRARITDPDSRLGGQILGLTVVGAIGLAVILPFVWPFVSAQREVGFHRLLREIQIWSASPLALLRAPGNSLLATAGPSACEFFTSSQGACATDGWLSNLHLTAAGDSERALYPGLVPLLLSIIGIWPNRSVDCPRKPLRIGIFILIAVVGLLLSFGPWLMLGEFGRHETGIPLPYLVLYNFVPGFDALRVPYRFGTVFMFGIAVSAAFGMQRLLGRLRHKGLGRVYWTGALLFSFLICEFSPVGVRTTPVALGEHFPDADGLYAWLARRESLSVVPEDALLVELPMDRYRSDHPEYVLQSLYHRRPMLNGSANLLPKGYPELVGEMRGFPNPRSVELLGALGVKFALVHVDALGPRRGAALQAQRQGLEFVRESGPQRLYRILPLEVADLRGKIPLGCSILLTDGGGLYTTAFAGILGPGYRYVATRPTIYASLVPSLTVVSAPMPTDYAVLYRNAPLEAYGCTRDSIVWSNEIVEVCRRNQ